MDTRASPPDRRDGVPARRQRWWGSEACLWSGRLDMGAVVIALGMVVEGDIASVLEHVAVAGIARVGTRL
jgi:hypothetical protein